MRVAILTVSDRSARGEREDRSGAILRELVEKRGWEVVDQAIQPDEQLEIERQLERWADGGSVQVILTTGGTGFAPRDRTPEATLAVIDRAAPGIAEAMRLASMRKTPHAMLSRAVAGIRGSTLIINLPGSPDAVRENIQAVASVLPHAVELLSDAAGAGSGHRQPPPPLHA